MREIQLNIDGREVKAEEGTTIFEAARKAGIKIPHLCYREDLTPTSGLPALRGGGGRGENPGGFLRLSRGRQDGRPDRYGAGAGCPETGHRVSCSPIILTTA